MWIFAVVFVDRISTRQLALVGLVNILGMPALLIWITRRWISKL
jgi:hypothetical protein